MKWLFLGITLLGAVRAIHGFWGDNLFSGIIFAAGSLITLWLTIRAFRVDQALRDQNRKNGKGER